VTTASRLRAAPPSRIDVPSKIDIALAALGAVVFVVWSAAYFVTYWSTTGQTPGARTMRFRVLAPGAQGGHIAPRRALLPLLAMIPCWRATSWCSSTTAAAGSTIASRRTVVVDAPDTETPVRRMRARHELAAPDQ
jgi:uncharacterized RDD family membrane protein YckC